MNVGDRVRHKKYGLGTVKAIYPKNDAARVKYDDGHETTNAQKRLSIVPSNTIDRDHDSDAGPGAPEQSSVRRRSGAAGTTVVDYKLLDRAKDYIWAQNPDAVDVTPRIYNGRVYCEVWDSAGGARIVFYEER